MFENSSAPSVTLSAVGEGTHIWMTTPEAFAVPILFLVIFVAGVAGNGTLIYIVLRHKHMRNVPNILLVSLAMGDMMLVVVSVPFTATIYSRVEWPYGEVICRLNCFLQTLSLGVSVFTLVALSIDRYFAIKNPMLAHQSSSMRRTVCVAALIWLISILLASYKLWYAHVNEEYVYCDTYPSTELMQFIVTFNLVIYFALPMTIITGFYVRMAQILVNSSWMIGESVQLRKQLQARKKVAKLVLCFVFVFIACWLPRHIYLMWFHYDSGQYNLFWHIFKIAGFCMSFINSCVNPLALYLLSRQFRQYYDRYLLCCCRRRTRGRQGAPGKRKQAGKPCPATSGDTPGDCRRTAYSHTEKTTAI